MPVRIVVVHDKPEFVRPLSKALIGAGYEVTAFANPMSALQTLEAAESIVSVDVLITRFCFGTPQPLGPSLARVTQAMHPEMSVIFVAESRFRASVKDLGEFISSQAEIEDVVAIVARRTSQLIARESLIKPA
jgi:CheY-like chemotaxis protein